MLEGSYMTESSLKSFARKTAHRSAGALIITTILLCAGCSRQHPNPIFEDVTLNSGLEEYQGMTYGAFWGDLNGDGLPDLYVTNHLHKPVLYQNQGNGKFRDVTMDWFSPNQLSWDKHGADWGDFDNDGRPDLVQLTGAGRGVGQEAKNLYHNTQDKLVDVATAMGTDNPLGRTRMPLWIDLDFDGHLDLIQGEEYRHDDKKPPRVFLQGNDKFNASDSSLPLVAGSVPFCIVSDLVGDTKPELVCRVSEPGIHKTAQVFDLNGLPAKEIDMLPATAFEDLVSGDFDNDGRIDLYMPRKYPAGTVALGQPSVNEIIADISIYRSTAGKAAGFRFGSTGSLDVQLAPEFPKFALKADRVAIGAGGHHPGHLTFSLSKETAGVKGLPPYKPDSDTGVQIGETASGEWEVRVSAPGEALRSRQMRFQDIQVRIRSSAAITGLTAIEDSGDSEEAPGRLFMNRTEGLVEESEDRGINDTLVSAVNAVAGDFDNDMDLDLFVLVSGDAGNHPNLYLENDGSGHFSAVEHAAGAAGPLAGVGDSVAMADYDQDGDLDLLIANGGSMGRQLGLPSEHGGYRLYRNTGNTNHWLEIDLQGVKSNRDAIGARVEVSTGGVTQVRIQDGGIHNKAQNYSRLHFGLGDNATIQTLKIHWPDGSSQVLENVAADQILKVVQQ